MTDRIQLKELKKAIEKAAAKATHAHLPGQGPLIFGFVAPDTIPAKEAAAIAKEVAVATGLAGAQPTVISQGAAQGAQIKTEALVKPHIIIGLVLDPNLLK